MTTRAQTLAKIHTRMLDKFPGLPHPEAWLARIEKRVGRDGVVRRVDGKIVGIQEVADLIVHAARAEEQAVAASPAPTDVTAFLVRLQQQIMRDRAALQAEAPRMDELLSRLGSPLDKIVPGR
jgi:hypothetical protein